MNPRLDALRRVLAGLPPASEQAWLWPNPEVRANGTIGFPHPIYCKGLEDAFNAFRDGKFGFAVGDKRYLDCLEAWQKRTGKDAFNPANAAFLDREVCLLIWRFFDRQERFADGAWTHAHSSGLLHSTLARLIKLET